MDAFVKIIGRPWDLFQGYNSEETVCILSGLTIPYTTLMGLEAMISEGQTEMKKILDTPKPILLQNDLDLFMAPKNDKPKMAASLNEVLSAFRN